MTTDSSPGARDKGAWDAGVWDEARRLLDEHGPWTTDGGAYLESDQVTVLVHPVFDEDHQSGVGAATVDLVVTVRPRRSSEPPQGAGVSLVATSGDAVFRTLSRRGQAVFRHLPAGEWRARLLDGGARSSSTSRASTSAMRTIPRLLAAAAGDRQHVVREVFTDADEGLRTEVQETPEARLVVRISAADPAGRVPLVRVRWAVVVPDVVEDVRSLVVPLAPAGDGSALTAKYDLGSLDLVEAVRIGPAQWAEPSELTDELVRRAFDFSLYGSARRAWEDLLASDACPPEVRIAVRDMLER